MVTRLRSGSQLCTKSVVCMGRRTSPKCTTLKYRDYDVTRSPVPPNAPGVGERLRCVVWIWSAKSARCTVKMVVEEWEVARGGNVDCSVECDTEW